MLIKKETSLEVQSKDPKETLDWKLKELEDKNLPVESGIADYVYFGFSNIDLKIEQLKNYKDAIIEEMNNLKSYKDTTSEEIASWIQEQGIDKLNGLKCSSITITKGSELKQEKVTKKIFVTTKNQDEINQFLVDNGMGEFIEKVETKVTAETKDKIRINTKKS